MPIIRRNGTASVQVWLLLPHLRAWRSHPRVKLFRFCKYLRFCKALAQRKEEEQPFRSLLMVKVCIDGPRGTVTRYPWAPRGADSPPMGRVRYSPQSRLLLDYENVWIEFTGTLAAVLAGCTTAVRELWRSESVHPESVLWRMGRSMANQMALSHFVLPEVRTHYFCGQLWDGLRIWRWIIVDTCGYAEMRC